MAQDWKGEKFLLFAVVNKKNKKKKLILKGAAPLFNPKILFSSLTLQQLISIILSNGMNRREAKRREHNRTEEKKREETRRNEKIRDKKRKEETRKEKRR